MAFLLEVFDAVFAVIGRWQQHHGPGIVPQFVVPTVLTCVFTVLISGPEHL
jgi:hypothetical protein